jgi:hypothetical protein
MAAGAARRTFLAVIISLLLVGTAGLSVYLMASSGVFSLGNDQNLPSAPGAGPSVVETADDPLPFYGGAVYPPRDPFEPLVTTATTVPGETTTTQPGETTTTQPGATTTTQPGATTTTQPGATTTTTQGVTPETKRITLLEIRDNDGVYTAVVSVDEVTYTVGVGDTFAGDFKVISLDSDSGVFMYGDNVFTLSVGQSIIK